MLEVSVLEVVMTGEVTGKLEEGFDEEAVIEDEEGAE